MLAVECMDVVERASAMEGVGVICRVREEGRIGRVEGERHEGVERVGVICRVCEEGQIGRMEGERHEGEEDGGDMECTVKHGRLLF